MSAATRIDSIDRALMHHQIAGVVHVYSPPERNGDASNRRSQWRIVFDRGLGAEVVASTPTAAAVCEALAASERFHLPFVNAVREIVVALASVEISADDSAAFERAERALLAAADLVAGSQ